MTLSYNSIAGGIPFGNSSQRPANPSIGQIYYNGQLAATEIYTSSGWAVMGALPESATIGTATDVGTNRPFNNAAASVTFTPSASGGLATSFTATSTPGGYTGTGSSSPVVVPGLASGTSYTFAVVASNAYGNALATTQTNSITATSVPTAPSIGTAINPSGQSYTGTASASVPFTQSANGGKAISNYKYSTDGTNYTALSPAQTSSPLTISGLTPGSSYSFYLKAVNENGDSAVSSVSNSVTVSTVPQAPTIGTVTKVNDTTVSIPFTPPANNGGSPITSYTVTSSPSIALSVSGGTTSPLTVSGSFGASVAYTFTISAVNANGTSVASSSSNSIIPYAPYLLSQTFNSSGTYTVPAGKNQLSVVVLGAGGSGGGGGGGSYSNDAYGSSGGGGSGGYGGGGAAGVDISVTPGQTYSVSVGSSNGSTSFSNLVVRNSGGQGDPGNAGGNQLTTSQNGGNGGGGGGGRGGYCCDANGAGGAGGNGANGPSWTISTANFNTNVTLGSGGGGGGGGSLRFNGPNLAGGSGGSGGNGAGSGGNGGNAMESVNGNSGNGSGTTGCGGGGGGGGVGSPFQNGNGGNGANGGPGQVIIYAR